MPDPGYGPNGERRDVVGPISWEANGPPQVIPAGDDVWLFFPLAVIPLPFIDQDDNEVWSHIYLGGV